MRASKVLNIPSPRLSVCQMQARVSVPTFATQTSLLAASACPIQTLRLDTGPPAYTYVLKTLFTTRLFTLYAALAYVTLLMPMSVAFSVKLASPPYASAVLRR